MIEIFKVQQVLNQYVWTQRKFKNCVVIESQKLFPCNSRRAIDSTYYMKIILGH
jgi:hypothetical protein